MIAIAVLFFALAFAWMPPRPPRAGARGGRGFVVRWRGRLERVRKKAAARRGGPRARRNSVELGVLVAETATRVRSGAPLERAWFATIRRAKLDGSGGAELDESGVPRAVRRMWSRRRKGVDVRLGVPATVAVCRLTRATGAPAADILDSCAAGITAATEAAGERKIAFSGPKSTVQVLSLLPILGFAMAFMFGGNPLEFFVSGPVGWLCAIGGAAIEAAGLVWTRRAIRRAETEH